MNYTTKKTYRVDWSSVFRTLMDVLFGVFLGCGLAVLIFMGVPV